MNVNLLKGKIKERGETQESVAKAIGISSNSLSRKLAGKREFRLSEIIRLTDFLELDNPCEIFLLTASQIRNAQNNQRIN